MTKNASIIITQCANGYIVNEWHPGSVVAKCDGQLVFQTMRELQRFLNGHFDYRCNGVVPDLQSVS